MKTIAVLYGNKLLFEGEYTSFGVYVRLGDERILVEVNSAHLVARAGGADKIKLEDSTVGFSPDLQARLEGRDVLVIEGIQVS